MSNGKYSFHLAWSEEDQVYFASCPEFPGLLTHGKTPDDAIAEAQVALQGIIEVYLEDGDPLPEPMTRQQYSGQFRVRIPKTLHRQAAEIARQEGVSLNTFVATAIAEKVGGTAARAIAIKPSPRFDSPPIPMVSTSNRVPVLEIGSQKFEEVNNLSVDAAKVNPRPAPSKLKK